MAKCKAITAGGTQCGREARDGLEFCAIPAHAEQEDVTKDAVLAADQNQYRIMILAVGAKSQPAIGGYSGQDVVALMQKNYAEGYELFSVDSVGQVELPGSASKDYVSVMYTFKLRG